MSRGNSTLDLWMLFASCQSWQLWFFSIFGLRILQNSFHCGPTVRKSNPAQNWRVSTLETSQLLLCGACSWLPSLLCVVLTLCVVVSTDTFISIVSALQVISGDTNSQIISGQYNVSVKEIIHYWGNRPSELYSLSTELNTICPLSTILLRFT